MLIYNKGLLSTNSLLNKKQVNFWLKSRSIWQKKDGKATLTNFLRAGYLLQKYCCSCEPTAKSQANEEVDEILKKFDADNAGSLSKAEFISALHGDDVFSLFK